MDQLGLAIDLRESSFPPRANDTRTAVIQVNGSAASGLFAWPLAGETTFVTFPQWFGSEIEWNLHVVGLEYKLTGDFVGDAEPVPQPLWKAVWVEPDEHATLFLLHQVDANGQRYFFENHSYDTVGVGGQRFGAYYYNPMSAQTQDFTINVSVAQHISATTGIPMNVATPDAECAVETPPTVRPAWLENQAHLSPLTENV